MNKKNPRFKQRSRGKFFPAAILLFSAILIFFGIRLAGCLFTSDEAADGDAASKAASSPKRTINKDIADKVNKIAGSSVPPTSASLRTKQETPLSSFQDCYYYESANREGYTRYQSLNPEMPPDEVVWRVNAGLDGEFYTDITDISNPNDLYVVVNKRNRLSSSFIPDDMAALPSGVSARKDAAEAYRRMAEAAARDGVIFIPQSGYRSYDYQNQLYTNYKATDPGGADTYSARPGFSEHQTGLTIDLNIPGSGNLRDFVGTEQAEWVSKNAHLFGFIVRYTEKNREITGYVSEPWHIRYIGAEHAAKMKETGIISFEEYKVKYIDHQPE